MNSWLSSVSSPPDTTAWLALALSACGLAGVLARGRSLARRLDAIRPRWLVGGMAVCAAVLSAGYVWVYLRGGPRIIDATAYYLEARALAAGHFAFPTPGPAGSFHGRFLLSAVDGSRLAVIFPPGYPALLALGFVLGCPLAVGPVLAAALVVATYALARRLLGSARVALLAAALSVVSATLRYHTADTMSHGWAALLVTLALLWTGRGQVGANAACGLACGWLLATRPVTGVVMAVACTMLGGRSAAARGAMGLGLVPGVVLLLLHQHAATGSWLDSSQVRYYTLADGPPGCFRYGFGAGVGCLYEHGEFVSRQLPNGYGLREALHTTARRLYWHTQDAANFAPLFMLVAAAAVIGRRIRPVLVLVGVVVAVALAYAPFYFDACYPGGGARLWVDVLPLEHILLAWAALRLRIGRFLLPIALLGFALHAGSDHVALSNREGGRPMFEPSVLALHGVDHGLVFVDTDHGFNLGHAPGVSDAQTRPVIARYRGDAFDTLLWRRLGSPPAYRYRYDPFAVRALPSVAPYQVPRPSTLLRFEAENLWPVRAVRAGWAHPTHLASACASAGRGLRLRTQQGQPASVTLQIAISQSGWYALRTAWVAYSAGPVEVGATVATRRSRARREAAAHDCWTLPPLDVHLDAGSQAIEVSASSSTVALDYIAVRPSGRPEQG